MKKILSLILGLLITSICVHAANTSKGDFSGIIKDSGISKDSIAISIRDAKTGKVIYEMNDTILMNPASVQKILTMPAVLDKLGKDYKFKTELYKSGENAYLIKLSGDPYLKSSDLKGLVRPIKPDTQNVYIDDSILDNKTWGEGWQWDDDMNALMPRFGAYNLDKNLIKISIVPSENGQYASILNPSKYPLVFFNTITTSSKTNLDIKRDNAVSANTIILSGTVARQTNVQIPSNNIKRYFEIQLSKALENNDVYLKNPFVIKNKSSNDILAGVIEHDLTTALSDILKNSNNMAAETVFKISGGGTDKGGIQTFKDYCAKSKIDSSKIKITDGSGVSKNNLVSADFVSEYLYLNKSNPAMEYLPKPGEGTLTQRMLPIKENLKAKTGTLADVSGIAGYLTSKKGTNYTFCILQNDVKLSEPEKKMLEDYIIRELYLKG